MELEEVVGEKLPIIALYNLFQHLGLRV